MQLLAVIETLTKCKTSQMTQGTRRRYSVVEVKAEAEIKIVVRS